ncbi:MAG: hypothetical protein ACTS2F_10650 [Thainema sp.]
MASNDPRHDNDRDFQLRQREADLKKRELEIRLRELEAELHQRPPATPVPQVEVQTVYPQKSATPETRWQRWKRSIGNFAKFCILVVVVLVAIRVSFWLANIIIIGTAAFVAYKLFFESKPNQ